MRRWVWAGAAAICASPQVLIMVLAMFGVWAGMGQIAAVTFHSEIAVVLLASFNALFAAGLFSILLNLEADLRELRTPQRRQLLTGALVFVLTLVVVVPAALVLSWRWAVWDVLVVVLGSIAAMSAAGLWTLLARRRAAEGVASVDNETRTLGSGWLPSRSRALRVALGPPYAPATWRARLLQFTLLFAVLFGPALLVIAFGRSLSSRAFAVTMHASEFVSLAVAILLCWIWPLSKAVALFNPTQGASMELALLPGLGMDKERLTRVYAVAIRPPAVALGMLLLVAMGAAWLERPANSVYVKLLVQFSLIALTTLLVFLGQIAKPQARGGRPVSFVLMLAPTYGYSVLVWNLSWEALASIPMLRWVSIAIVLMLLVLAVGMFLFLLQKIRQRPHPFVDVST